jgi:hypothetical protein
MRVPPPAPRESFLTEGDRVEALVQISETFPGASVPHIHAEPGDLGECEFTEPGVYPTVRFERTGTASAVTPEEVRKVASEDEVPNDALRRAMAEREVIVDGSSQPPARDTFDPVAEARQWAATNFQAPGAVHVLAALTSAERYRILSEHSRDVNGSKVVLVTIGGEKNLEMYLTSPDQMTDERVGKFAADYFHLIQSVARDIAREGLQDQRFHTEVSKHDDGTVSVCYLDGTEALRVHGNIGGSPEAVDAEQLALWIVQVANQRDPDPKSWFLVSGEYPEDGDTTVVRALDKTEAFEKGRAVLGYTAENDPAYADMTEAAFQIQPITPFEAKAWKLGWTPPEKAPGFAVPQSTPTPAYAHHTTGPSDAFRSLPDPEMHRLSEALEDAAREGRATVAPLQVDDLVLQEVVDRIRWWATRDLPYKAPEEITQHYVQALLADLLKRAGAP